MTPLPTEAGMIPARPMVGKMDNFPLDCGRNKTGHGIQEREFTPDLQVLFLLSFHTTQSSRYPLLVARDRQAYIEPITMSPYLSAEPLAPAVSTYLANVAPYLESDPAVLPDSLDPFTVTAATGFMPLHPPLIQPPAAFDPVASLVENMPVQRLDGTPGLLATYQLGRAIDDGALPNLTLEIAKLTAPDGKLDLAKVTAIFRDYSFLSSAYLLEPCYERWDKGLEGYGLGRQVLPACLAGPLVKTAAILEIPPFMAYAAAYSLYNYRVEDPAIGLDKYSNLRTIRAFQLGLDPLSSEAGFILTHVDMVKHSAGLVGGSAQLLDAVRVEDKGNVLEAFALLLDTMQVIEQSMETMWSNSKPKDYLGYRTFIFGITNQSMFPNGVIYEGENGGKPMFVRGESGANDSMIPLLDGLLQVPMPANPLTETLKDFRSYRPKPHREFLAGVRQQADAIGVREYCCKDVDVAVCYLKLLDHVRSFRWRHWMFAREYIIKRSEHPTATGGSPIIRWLPNQLFAVMDLMSAVWEGINEAERQKADRSVTGMMACALDQRQKLQKEVTRWCQERAQ
ncbi:hypothetical protein LTR57_002815 [Friedmanniomyces endolithicus]|uniref:Indoleamine 2,3-dioxygenase n=2 Tax=Friedmanniomyces endolithicus TaxID=329885 RepID=A0AAN6FN33_9PEZI|nr:hypothetical protein LTR35_006622 [Friedmanniomyces endolithicus]KAK0297116.1 hypothetical protein LTS00_004395 [Friedmanniomyces endolithicus]KAK0320677.1 hypothetical protein LTR82_008390 [Friedmanniomyces endolithicus]KAK0928081.1 hypothetical protein LTR57_002815 [Friedmanniomyces endolithicus]KAK1003135.1 hypothetical protein LTS01_004006 [Friedmanniomyces endolithicus]